MNPDPSQVPAPADSRTLHPLEVCLLLAVVVVCRIFACKAFPIYDDAFITYRYATHLGQSLGLVFNPGAPWEPVLGTTTPGYAVLLGGLRALGLDVVRSSLAINFVCDAVSAWLIIQLLSRRVVASTVAVVAFACIPEIARISVGGMEPPMVVVLALAATYALRRERPVVSGTFAAFCCLFRPEAVLLVFVLLGWHLFRSRRDALRFCIPIAVVGAISMGILTAIYGSPISQSVSAKATQHGASFDFNRVPPILRQSFAPSLYMAAVLVFVVMGLVAAVRRRSGILPFVVFTTSIVVAYVLAQPKTWGWYYYAPLVAWVSLLGIGAADFAGWIGERRLGLESRLRWLPATFGALALVAVWTYSNLRPDEITPLVYERLEQWADEEGIDGEVTILASDIGAIGFFTGARILDTEGLVWPGAFDHANPNAIVRAHLPDYVMIVVNDIRLTPFAADEELLANYEPVVRLNKLGSDSLSPSVEKLTPHWIQDYLIYRRRATLASH